MIRSWLGRYVNIVVKYLYGSSPFAFAVSIMLYAFALDSAPDTLAENNQFFLPVVNGRITLSSNEFVIGIYPSDESCIQVAIYDDRLEVTSPGGLYNGLTYEEVMNGHSKIRNKGIANIFSQMGLVEAWGSGIKRILNAAEEYGLPKPKFQEFDNMFRVELFRVNPITDQANQATNQANQDLERLDQVEDENVLSEKEIEILNLVRMQPSITQKEMANALDWNLASVKYYITKLKEKNYLKRQGSSQKGKWVILTKRD